MRDETSHAPCHRPLQEHLVPTLVQRRLVLLFFGQWQGLPRRQQREAALQPRAAAALEGRRRPAADPPAARLELDGAHTHSRRAVGQEGNAVRLVELLLHHLQHGVVSDTDPVSDRPLRGDRGRRGLQRDHLAREVVLQGAGLELQQRRGEGREKAVVLFGFGHCGLVDDVEPGTVVELQAPQVPREKQQLLRDLGSLLELRPHDGLVHLQAEVRALRPQRQAEHRREAPLDLL
mmetsp:Transcript_3902/g.11756  ORF Transcript_3902/g.11756 Transcript_3902/m.11756 type:complete len:234 (+) Transcript_3902:3918-4619(+)